MQNLEEKDKELSILKATLEKNKSSINCEQDDISKKCEIIQKNYNDLQVECNSNRSKMNHLEEELKNLE